MRVCHTLADEVALDVALEPLESVGWIARCDDVASGLMWLVPPPGVDPYAALTQIEWVTTVGALATPPSSV